MRPLLASAAVYIAMTWIIGHRVIAGLGSAIANDAGDPLLTTAILTWNATHLPWSDAWYQFPIFSPTRDALTLSEHLLGVSLINAPIQWLTGNPVLAYNVTLLLSYPLCGLSMYLLVWRLTRKAAAAFLAGLAYAFMPFRAGQLAHIQMLVAFWMPIALVGLHGFLETRRRSWLVLFAVAWSLQGAANGYYLVYFTLVVGLWVIWFMAARRRWHDVVAVAVAMVAAMLPLAPVLIRYITAQRALGLSRNIGEITALSADIAAPLCASSTLAFWGWLRMACAQEGELFPGGALIAVCLIASVSNRLREPSKDSRVAVLPHRRWHSFAIRGLLSVAALYGVVMACTLAAGPWRIDLGWLRASASSADKPATVALVCLLAAGLLSRRFRDTVRSGSTPTFYVLAALVCWVLAWGPFPRVFGRTVLYQAPYAWLLELPGFNAMRVPARLWMMVVLCLVVFMGLGIARFLSAQRKQVARVIVAAAAAGLAADGWTTIGTAQIPPSAPSRELAGRTVLILPVADQATDIAVVYHAVRQEYNSINGFSGYEPLYYEALRTLSADMDGRLFEPFVSRGEVDVLVKSDNGAMRSFVEQQPGHELISSGRFAHYRVPRRPVSPADTRIPPPLPVRRVEATCSEARARLVADGDLTTRWECGAQTSDQAITLELGEVTQVAAIVHALGTFGTDFPRRLHIETSLDGQTWTEAWQGSPAAAVLPVAMAAPREARALITFPRRAAKYLRLRQTGRSELYYWSIAELEIRGGR